MSSVLVVPKILDITDKLIPLIEKFNDYRFFLVDGGRVSGKSQSVARLLLTIADMNTVRIVCGRETQATIEESVYTLFKDLIIQFNLNWDVKSTVLEHKVSGSTIIFKGFREQGSVNIKGLEGIDILWVEEAQAITQKTLDIIIPTIRKPKSKIFFTMNRTVEDDPVYKAFKGRDDCLKLTINYIDNKFCPAEVIIEAEKMKEQDINSYNHIWLGVPLANGNNFVFPKNLLDHCCSRYGMPSMHNINRGVALDPAGMGVDDNVFLAGNFGEPIEWFEKTVMSPMEKAIKAVEICKLHNAWWIVVDCDGLGIETYQELIRLPEEYLGGIVILKFHGSQPSEITMCDRPMYHNKRAEAAYISQKRAYAGFATIMPDDDKLKEELAQDTSFMSGRGLQQLVAKEDIKKIIKRSPGRADCWKMFQWACDKNIPDQRIAKDTKKRYNKDNSDDYAFNPATV